MIRLKVYSRNVCPVCGKENAAHRTRRSRVLRWVRPGAQLMKCRMCLTRYLIRSQPPPDSGAETKL